MLELEAGGVEGLEIVVSPYRPLAVPATSRPASYAPGELGARDLRSLMAGEVVTVRASGRYTVGSFYDQSIDPAGYPDGDAKRYNFQAGAIQGRSTRLRHRAHRRSIGARSRRGQRTHLRVAFCRCATRRLERH